MFEQDAGLMIVLENFTWNTTNCNQSIDDMAPLIAGRELQLERQREDMDGAIQTIKESRSDNKCSLEQAANLRAEDLHIGHLAIAHKSILE